MLSSMSGDSCIIKVKNGIRKIPAAAITSPIVLYAFPYSFTKAVIFSSSCFASGSYKA